MIAFKSFNQNISLLSFERLIRSTRKNSDQPKNVYIHTIFIYINGEALYNGFKILNGSYTLSQKTLKAKIGNGKDD